MKTRSSVAVAALLLGVGTAHAAGEIAACEALNRVGAANRMREYTDKEVERLLCQASTLTVEAISKKREAQEHVCLQAMEHLMREFKRRFPGRDPKETTKAC